MAMKSSRKKSEKIIAGKQFTPNGQDKKQILCLKIDFATRLGSLHGQVTKTSFPNCSGTGPPRGLVSPLPNVGFGAFFQREAASRSRRDG